MLGHKPEAVMRQVLNAAGAPPEQIAGVGLFHSDKCDEELLLVHPASSKHLRRTLPTMRFSLTRSTRRMQWQSRTRISRSCALVELFHVISVVRVASSRNCAAQWTSSLLTGSERLDKRQGFVDVLAGGNTERSDSR